MAPRAPQGEQIDVGSTYYLSRRTTIDQIKEEIITLLSAGPATANQIKYGLAGGSAEILTARDELESEGRIAKVPARGGRYRFTLTADAGPSAMGG